MVQYIITHINWQPPYAAPWAVRLPFVDLRQHHIAFFLKWKIRAGITRFMVRISPGATSSKLTAYLPSLPAFSLFPDIAIRERKLKSAEKKKSTMKNAFLGKTSISLEDLVNQSSISWIRSTGVCFHNQDLFDLGFEFGYNGVHRF